MHGNLWQHATFGQCMPPPPHMWKVTGQLQLVREWEHVFSLCALSSPISKFFLYKFKKWQVTTSAFSDCKKCQWIEFVVFTRGPGGLSIHRAWQAAIWIVAFLFLIKSAFNVKMSCSVLQHLHKTTIIELKQKSDLGRQFPFSMPPKKISVNFSFVFEFDPRVN